MAEISIRTILNSTINGIGAITFGIGSLIFSILFFKISYIPRSISIYGLAASLFVIIGMAMQMAGVSGSIILLIWMSMLLSELKYGFWLFSKGVDNGS